MWGGFGLGVRGLEWVWEFGLIVGILEWVWGVWVGCERSGLTVDIMGGKGWLWEGWRGGGV